ncbi:MAG: histidine ammonia-lyase [Candidatus Cloacimonadales bacterium]|jgi:histidine ammonia-lyase|nr:histidine ammonia-lyase [Candidatus Cloacimonadota bacterium]MDD2650007.1 histidine ammonia-lyase [Candidatus Cloacimonadota bacterium]MDD3501160.1 histidine ammonia-lyase [Candidatus Cloacimonadota bacterium]MDX9976532.1 histidine ammonia-lyase [Candidatus Cloacimonadales bacterium]
MEKTIYIDGNSLTLEQVYDVAFNRVKVKLTEDAIEKINKCRTYVEKVINEGRIVYGLTTGFGKFSTISIDKEDIEELQTNLILSHATGVGNYLSIEETRAIHLLRANVLAKGNSGIRLSTLQTLIDMLNAGIHPCIPEKGSVGASGDLAPLSHLALVLLGYGEAEYKGEIIDGGLAMKKAGITPVKLAAKEGLALNNGTQVMTGIMAINIIKAEALAKSADIVAALTVDALTGTPAAYDALIHQLRPHNGQMNSAANLTELLKNSPLRQSHINCKNVQDAYSLRCTPQVNGAVRDALTFVRQTLEVEINSATDNPLIFPDEDKVLSGGNFHGEPVAFSADILGFTVSELGNISERRQEQMFNPALNRGLNAFLAPRPGIDSGFMIAQLTSASLISENKVLAHPASVDSIPTSANQEDHVSMGTIGAVKARTILNNTTYVLGIELMAACQALESRSYETSEPLAAVKKEFREVVKVIDKDRIFYPDIEKSKSFIESTKAIEIVERFIKLK